MARNSWLGACTSLERSYPIMLSFLTRIWPSDLVCGSVFTKDISNLVYSYRISLRSCEIRHDRSFRYLIWSFSDQTRPWRRIFDLGREMRGKIYLTIQTSPPDRIVWSSISENLHRTTIEIFVFFHLRDRTSFEDRQSNETNLSKHVESSVPSSLHLNPDISLSKRKE